MLAANIATKATNDEYESTSTHMLDQRLSPALSAGGFEQATA
jgi:hypothetical protein